MTFDVLADADEAAARAAKAAGVVIRELESLNELEAMTALFDQIWAPDAGNPSMRLDLLRALTKAGNYASGAYDAGNGELLGACVGFFGPPSQAELHSHIAGVRPPGLGRSVGFALKVHQRAWCLRRDVRLIAWTYDPLIRRNAYFNLAKLGARPVEYLRNFYGVMDDVINGGTETDRMLVHWDLRSAADSDTSAGRPRPASFDAQRARGAVVALSAGPDGLPVPGLPLAGGSGARSFLVGVPADIEAMRLARPAHAAMWRTALRDVLSPLLSGGARVTGFDRDGWYIVTTGVTNDARRDDDAQHDDDARRD
ncbi:MAG TPA: GNAT family N-acetyltransferase [Trebonia sp.]|jgi:predicted GNAT superfamily acetyltransferase